MKTIDYIKRGLLLQNEVNATTIVHETYYNCLQLCLITGYSDPIAALKATSEIVTVKRDDCGNILSGEKLATRAMPKKNHKLDSEAITSALPQTEAHLTAH